MLSLLENVVTKHGRDMGASNEVGCVSKGSALSNDRERKLDENWTQKTKTASKLAASSMVTCIAIWTFRRRPSATAQTSAEIVLPRT